MYLWTACHFYNLQDICTEYFANFSLELIFLLFSLFLISCRIEDREDRESIVNDMKVEGTALVIFCIILTKCLIETIYGKKRFIWTPSLRGISIHIDREGMKGLVAVQACDKFSSHCMHLEAVPCKGFKGFSKWPVLANKSVWISALTHRGHFRFKS